MYMFARVSTVTLHGIEANPVDVQVSVGAGLPSFTIVGLADKAVAESRERIRAALGAIGLALPPKRITVNLSPADLPKEGSHYDLPIALGLMIATGALPGDLLEAYCVIGELALDGSISPVVGALPAAIGASAHERGLICPAACGAEAAWAGEHVELLAPPDLLSLVNHFKGHQVLSRPGPGRAAISAPRRKDLADVHGQDMAKRALEVAAAGGHNLLMIGPPGAGKSMLAERLPSILPPLSAAEMLEVSMIQSMAGLLSKRGMSQDRPFRAPHHSASMAALVGGGTRPQPGEVALAHLGVLFLDELPEFAPRVLDALRQPLESGEITIARANHRIAYPARFQLVAAMNPCRCGRADEPGFRCRRGVACEENYRNRISGPLLDRIDIQIGMAAVPAAELARHDRAENSAQVQRRVNDARARQTERYSKLGQPGVRTNADCPAQLLEELFALRNDARNVLIDAAQKWQLTARGYHRTLRVARTLADLDDSPEIAHIHIIEALGLRGERLQRAAA
jgi:magnesium chelatase family protein